MMAYYIHRLRCFLALLAATWSQAGASGSYADWQFQRDLAKRRRARAEELARELETMRRVRP